MAAPRGSEVWRDYVTDGIPSSGNNNPKKSDARAWSSWLESLVTSGVLSSGPWFSTKAAMTLAYAANTIAVVYNDATAANNGLYIKVGASGSGSWTQLTSFLPGYQFVTASPTGESTANAIVALTSPRLPSGDGVALITLAIPATNTATPVTVRFDGGAVLTIKTRTGEDPDAGELQQNDLVTGFVSGANFRLISDLNSLRNYQSAKAWANNDEDAPIPAILGGDGATTFSAKHWAAKSEEDADRSDDEADRSEVARVGAESARDQAAGYVNDIVSEKEVPITATRNGMEVLQFPAGMNSLETRGYAVMGVGRAAYVRVNAEPAHGMKVRSADRVLPNGSVDPVNGGWWEIAEDEVSVRMAGARTGEPASVNTEAFQRVFDFAAERGLTVRVPAGSYSLNAKLTAAKPLSVRGDAMGSSRLQWTGGDGIEITVSSAPRTYEFSNISLETFAVADGVALKFDHSGLIVGDFIFPRAETNVKLHHVQIKGALGSPEYIQTGWRKAIEGVSMQGLDIDSCRFNGVYTGAYGSIPDSEIGIHFHGEGAPVQLTVARTFVSAWAIGALLEDAEGCYFIHNEFVTVGIGIKETNATQETAMVWSGGHIAAIQKCFELNNTTEFFIGAGAVLFPIGPQTGDFIGIHLLGTTSYGVVSGASFRRSNITSLYRGVVVDSGAGLGVVIEGNSFGVGSSVGCVAIDILAGAVAPTIGKNSYTGTGRKIRNASAAKVNASPVVLAQSAVPEAHTGTTALTTKVTVPVPADIMGMNGRLRITVALSFTNNANAKALQVYLGGSALAISTQTTNLTARLQFEIANRGAGNSQIITNNFGATPFAFTAGAVNTLVDEDLTLRCQLANAGDTITIESYLVEVLPGA